ncbi:DNA-packaging protein gp3 [Marinobacter segnicrescens]|uniref:DNA-packaging protein gp3 n=1 Tax=Marinobacter segnicrescens TaxID=430453 RepID=A0A1I0H7C4_9GAMM|nr:terminase small subunit [Marinobacter segnicrescens]SET79541.1 DNA-packaging protein gp3 [Marinobacter segnicrescens]
MATRKTAAKKKPAQKKTNPVGRPTKYEPRFAQMLIDHFDVEPGFYSDVQQRDGTTKKVYKANVFPTIAGFCRKIGITKKTLHNWAHETKEDGSLLRPEFLHAYEMAKETQEEMLTTNGLMGSYQGNFAALVAKNLLDWRDKSSSEISGPGGTPIQQSTKLDLSPEAAAAISKSLEDKF